MKEIPEYPAYLITEDGRLFSTKSNRFLKTFTNSAGYLYFTIRHENKNKNLLTHRVLARVYKDLPSLDSELEVDHDDCDKLNNALDNLIVRTKQEHIIKTCIERGNRNPKSIICMDCGVKISHQAIRCRGCSDKERHNKPAITAEQIEYWVCNYSWVRAGKELGYSDNGLRKKYKALTGKDPKNINAG